jgi:hypothetical protein
MHEFRMTDDSAQQSSFDSSETRVAEEGHVEIQGHDRYKDKTATIQDLVQLVGKFPLPETKGAARVSQVRHVVFSAYRRLFFAILLINLVFIITGSVFAYRTPLFFTYQDAMNATAANIFAAILMRHQPFINLVWRVCTAVPHSWPLGLRRRLAKVYSYGGLHSSCGISAAAWYLVFVVLLLLNFDRSNETLFAGLAATSGFMIVLFLVLLTMSIPQVRQKLHNAWEMSHRFAGWTAIAVVWTQLSLVAYWDGGIHILQSPPFWLLLATSYLIVFPWFHLRRLKFTAEKMSSHATRLHFHEQKQLPSCVGIQLSTQPLLENHSFATIPEPDGEPGYSCIVANNGDWTKKLVENPPEHLWTRSVPALGVIRLTFLFRRIVIVATGSGMGPCLSFLNVHPDRNCRILWSTRAPGQSWGDGVMASVMRADERAVIIDTLKVPKDQIPGLTAMTYALYRESAAEAVVVISNPKTTREVVYALESRDVPAYGAIWDS